MFENEIYHTQNFYLAVSAYASGFFIEGVAIDPQTQQAEFCFRESDKLQRFLKDYMNHQVKVEAQSHFNAYKYLKNYLNEMKRKAY